MQDAVLVQAELELGVGDDDAAGGGVFGGGGVEGDADVAHLGGQLLADAVFHLFEGDVLVVLADVGLGGRGEQRLGQLVGLAQAGGQLDAADGAACLIVLPAGADDVAAHDGFHQDRLEALGHDGAAAHLFHFVRRDHGFRRHAGQVVRHDVAELLEPEVAHLVQHHALARDRLVHDHVEGRQAVGGDDQDLVVADGVVVAHFAAAEQWQGLDSGFVEAVHRRDIRETVPANGAPVGGVQAGKAR